MYGLSAVAAQDNAESGAREALGQYLANDFDPIPCPACGHYQPFILPKLIEARSPWPATAAVAALIVGLASFVSVLYWGINYLTRPSDHALWRRGAASAALAVTGLIGAGLSAAERNRVRRFDPNADEDQESRIAKGRSRAVTRAEFEAMQQPGPPPGT